MLLNRARRAVRIPGFLSAAVFTGTEKVRCGYGNGDCVLVDPKDRLFGVADATERFPEASRRLLMNLVESVESEETPDDETSWVETVNRAYRQQSYNMKTTISCIALSGHYDSTSYVIQGGDSMVVVIDPENGETMFKSSADMNFAGRAPELTSVHGLKLPDTPLVAVLASDGFADLARQTGSGIEDFCLRLAREGPIEEADRRVADIIRGLPEGAEYDDVAVLVMALPAPPPVNRKPVLIGGTGAASEKTFQRNLKEGKLADKWLSD